MTFISTIILQVETNFLFYDREEAAGENDPGKGDAYPVSIADISERGMNRRALLCEYRGAFLGPEMRTSVCCPNPMCEAWGVPICSAEQVRE